MLSEIKIGGKEVWLKTVSESLILLTTSIN